VSHTLSLGWRTLARRPRRLALFVAGITVAAAVLIDMVMLAEGLQRSLIGMLEETGYQVRVLPKGLLPFETGAVVAASDSLARQLARDPRVDEAIPFWGQTVYVPEAGRDAQASFAYGAPAGTSPGIRIRSGRRVGARAEVVIDRNLAAAIGARIGETLDIGTEPDPATGELRRERALRVVGVADILFAAEESANLAMTIEDLWALAGTERRPAALLLVRVKREADAYGVARDLRARLPNLDVYAIPELIEAAGDRLSYFEQLSLVLGSVSLVVAFLLVSTLLTLSVNERWGEIATLRAIGVTRARMLAQVAWQGLLVSGGGTLVGIGVGLLVARYLDRILTNFPGLPAGVSFFVLRWGDAASSVMLLVATGLVAGLYPAWRAANVNIAAVLREEMG
jgi:putative ABC transport system permease protein